jgi:hypothetical protein
MPRDKREIVPHTLVYVDLGVSAGSYTYKLRGYSWKGTVDGLAYMYVIPFATNPGEDFESQSREDYLMNLLSALSSANDPASQALLDILASDE